jgi:hypothetical protein
MEYDVLTVTMIIYDQSMYQLSRSAEWCTYDDMSIGWNNNDVFAVTMMIYDKSCEKDIDKVNIDTLIRISLRIPYYFYWYPLTIIERYTIMIHNQTTILTIEMIVAK